MATLQNFDKLQDVLRAKLAQSKQFNKKVVVGFTASYAVYVHENLQAKHTVGQAKFLEQPAREKQTTIAEIITRALQNGLTMEQALMLGGLYLQGEAQKLTPVKTGNLRNSAFTRVDDLT